MPTEFGILQTDRQTDTDGLITIPALSRGAHVINDYSHSDVDEIMYLPVLQTE